MLAGDGAGALGSLRRQYDYGVDPLSVFRSLLETVHGVTLAKVGTPEDAAQPAEERAARREWAGTLSFPALHRLWQLFLKGHDEVAHAALPIEAAEMALLRAIHASTLPDPGELARQIASGKIAAPVAAPTAAPAPSDPAPEPVAASAFPATFAALVDALENNGALGIAAKLRHGARVVGYDPPALVLSGSRPMSADTLGDLNGALKSLSGQAWRVSFADSAGAPTLRETEDAAEEAAKAAILETPIIKAAFDAFPESVLEKLAGQTEHVMKNLDEILAMAQNVQNELAKAQENLDTIEVEGASGGGLVKVKASAKGRIIGIAIDDSLIQVSEKQMLEDLLTAAFNDARAKADAVSGSEMSKMTSGLPLPPGFKLPF